MGLDSIVQITINKLTKTVSKKSFGIAIMVGPNPTFSERLKYYDKNSMSALEAELTNGVADPEYKMAAAAFAQSPSPTQIAIGREDAGDTDMTATLNAIVLEQPNFFIVNLTSTDQTKQEDAAAWCLLNKRICCLRSDDTSIINRTDSQDSLDTVYITFSADLITGNVVDMDINTVSMTQVPFNTDHDTTMDDIVTNLGLLADVTAELDASDANNRTIKIVKAGATILVENALVTLGISQATITSKYASIASIIKSTSNANAGVFYHNNVTNYFIDAAFAGGIAVNFGANAPGGYTGAFKTLSGVTVTNLTPTQSTNALAKRVNIYEEIGERNIIQYGTVGDGDYYDITVLAFWTESRIQEEIYGDLVNLPKLPYDDEGYAAVKSSITTVLDQGIRNKGFTQHSFDEVTKERNGGYVVTLPTSISSAERASREFAGTTFEAYLAGAIHKVKIVGTLLY